MWLVFGWMKYVYYAHGANLVRMVPYLCTLMVVLLKADDAQGGEEAANQPILCMAIRNSEYEIIGKSWDDNDDDGDGGGDDISDGSVTTIH